MDTLIPAVDKIVRYHRWCVINDVHGSIWWKNDQEWLTWSHEVGIPTSFGDGRVKCPKNTFLDYPVDFYPFNMLETYDGVKKIGIATHLRPVGTRLRCLFGCIGFLVVFRRVSYPWNLFMLESRLVHHWYDSWKALWIFGRVQSNFLLRITYTVCSRWWKYIWLFITQCYPSLS